MRVGDLDRRVRRYARDIRTTSLSFRDPVYRRLSRSYRLPDGSRRIYCFHVRKTAGTSLHFSFLALGGEDPAAVQRRMESSALHRTTSADYAFVAHQRRLIEQGHYFYAWSHAPAHRLRLPPSTFTVTILRDPVERVVSHYSYLREGDRPGMAFAVGAAERSTSTKGFSSFLDDLAPEHLLRQLFMFSRCFDVSEAAEAITRCSCVIFTEDYHRGLSALSNRLSLSLLARRERASSDVANLSDAEQQRLREMLEPEYEMIRRVRSSLSSTGSELHRAR